MFSGFNVPLVHGWVATAVGIVLLIGAVGLVTMFIIAIRTPGPSGPSPIEQERLPQKFDRDDGP
jgi:hypothetical protein